MSSETGPARAAPKLSRRFDLRPEQELVQRCARTAPLTPAAQEQVRALLGEDLDAEYLIRWAAQHGVLPLAHRQLRRMSEVPRGLAQELEARARHIAMRNLHQVQELHRVLALLKAHGIAALPFKGPTLAELVYGDVAARPFSDLDLLVREGDRAQAQALLLEGGYRFQGALTRASVAQHVEVEKSYELERGDVTVELHWDFMHPMHGFYLNPEDAWTRAQTAEVLGQPVQTLAPEDLVLYLCVHGSKHFWVRFSWLCDVAESLRAYQKTLEWPTLLARARSLHARRMLLLGLALAHMVLEAPVPAAVVQAATQDAAVQRLLTLSCERLFGPLPSEAPGQAHASVRTHVADARFHLLMRERWRDRLPYYRHLAKLALTPTANDRALLGLPPRLAFLYYAVRPVRLLGSGIARAVRASRRRAE